MKGHTYYFSFFLVLGLLGMFGLLTVAGPQLLWSADFNADVSIDSKITLIQDAGSGSYRTYSLTLVTQNMELV